MQKNWTTTSGKKVEMVAELTGKTRFDHIAHHITLTIDGNKMIVNGQATEQGKHCIVINIGGKKALVTIPAEIYVEMDAELKAAQTFDRPDTSVQDAKDLADYLFAQSMSNPNSDN
jgi:hypothetical protein